MWRVKYVTSPRTPRLFSAGRTQPSSTSAGIGRLVSSP